MSRGGMRYGAGRPAQHAKTSDALRIDVRRLQRDGYLDSRHEMTWRWSNGAVAGIKTAPDTITFTYRYRVTAEWQAVLQVVRVTRTACRFGGSRPWFVCPRCARRAAILYLHGWPACRTCARLVYPSQSDDAIGRSWGRTYRILRRVGQGDGSMYVAPRRPKGMRKATFDRLWEAWCREEEYRDSAIEAFAARIGFSW